MSRKFAPVTIAGTNGARLETGDTVTGSAQRDVVIQNGLVRVTYESLGAANYECHSMYRWDGSAYTRCTSTTYGDRMTWAAATAGIADRTIIVASDPDEVTVALEWDAHAMPSNTFVLRDHLGNPIYTSGGALRYFSTMKLTKVVKVKRGREGMFVGVRSFPSMSTPWSNTENAAGDRSFGWAEVEVSFSSNNRRSSHPNAGYTYYLGIEDPASASGAQDAAFPGDQDTGPWWIGSLSYDRTTFPFCRYIVMEHQLCGVSSQYQAGQFGNCLVLYMNDDRGENGLGAECQVFFGCFPYTVSDITAEPTALLKARVAARAAAVFDDSGVAQDDEPIAQTTAAQIRDLMIRTVRQLVPDVAAERRFQPHVEISDFIDFCERNPQARRFSIRDTGETLQPTVTDASNEQIETEFSVLVAYPLKENGWGSLAGLSRDDVIESDAKQIDNAIGTTGYFLLDTSSGGDACVRTVSVRRDRREACEYLDIRLNVLFWRSFS